MFESEHPARRAALLSREYVQTHNKEGWLGLYAEDAVIEDPIGVSMLDPEGKGHRGPAAREIHHSYAAGNEVANHITILTEIPAGEGKLLVKRVTGIFTYHVDEQGKLLSLRGYWEEDDPANSLEEVELAGGDSQ